MDQYIDIISAPDAWQIADDEPNDEDEIIDRELKPTNSARRVKALVEQVTGSCASSVPADRSIELITREQIDIHLYRYSHTEHGS